jgi:hypothetical protein
VFFLFREWVHCHFTYISPEGYEWSDNEPIPERKHIMEKEPLQYKRPGGKIIYCYSCDIPVWGWGSEWRTQKRCYGSMPFYRPLFRGWHYFEKWMRRDGSSYALTSAWDVKRRPICQKITLRCHGLLPSTDLLALHWLVGVLKWRLYWNNRGRNKSDHCLRNYFDGWEDKCKIHWVSTSFRIIFSEENTLKGGYYYCAKISY